MVLSAISQAAGISTTGNDRQGIADDFDTFLQILTTQLQNQNPLEPLDTNEFTNQLVQFSEVEQSIKANESLAAIAQVSAAAAATNAVSFIGKKVTVESAQAPLENNQASWDMITEQSSDGAQLSIRNDQGQVVWTGERDLVGGRQNFNWDGRDSTGQRLPDGQYQLSVNATNSDGSTQTVKLEVDAIVDGVDFQGNDPKLFAGGRELSLGDVRTVRN